MTSKNRGWQFGHWVSPNRPLNFAVAFCGAVAPERQWDIKVSKCTFCSVHLFNHHQQSELIMTTSKDVPRLTNSSGTTPIPTNPETYHQKSNPGLPANPRLAYPTAQSASVHREVLFSFLALISQRLVAMHHQPCPLKVKHNGLVRPAQATPTMELPRERTRQAVLEIAIRDFSCSY